jgi:hypothetical protein
MKRDGRAGHETRQPGRSDRVDDPAGPAADVAEMYVVAVPPGSTTCRPGGEIGQPWRAFQRGSRRLMTRTRPCRRMTTEPGRDLSDRIDVRTFM